MVNKMNKNREIQKRLNRQTDANIDELKLGKNLVQILISFMTNLCKPRSKTGKSTASRKLIQNIKGSI